MYLGTNNIVEQGTN